MQLPADRLDASQFRKTVLLDWDSVTPEKLSLSVFKMNLGWVASKVKVCHLHAEVGLLWRLPYLPRVLVSISASFLPSSGFSNPRVPLRQLQSVP